jgi:hypothetical protein
MPKMYEEIRDKLVKKGMKYDAAQKKAAMIYNGKRKKNKKLPKLSNKGD